MPNVCGRCRRPMSSHGDHASRLEAWIISRPALLATSSGPASEISSLVSGDDFSDRLLVSTSSPLAQQDLVVQTQNGVNMVSGTATTAPSTATTAPNTAPTAPVNGRAKHNRTYCSYCCTIRSSGHAQCHSKSLAGR